ncbi:hypothetical protein AVEN_184412-1 [Araneus ventricosus]|uniref:Uncharacterized protein n=1 Tax=Araneus ventricosus TaxID=182803 RepID=A0A4Y2BFI2_ARAVE|nr:hypothetical protein AVEN_184412-1 [Araneus ventricosus]
MCLKAVSVSGGRYAALLQNNIIPELQVRQALYTVTFMLDGAPPHIVMAFWEYHDTSRILSTRLVSQISRPDTLTMTMTMTHVHQLTHCV